MRTYRVQLRDVFQAHDAALEHGGRAGVLDVAAIESAIGRPYIGYHRRIYQKAGALVESLARNHGFADGNKRTAFIVVKLFVRRSGYQIVGINDTADAELEEMIVGLAGGHPLTETPIDWFKHRLVLLK